MQNKLRTLWKEGASAVNAWLGIPSTVTAEIVWSPKKRLSDTDHPSRSAGAVSM